MTQLHAGVARVFQLSFGELVWSQRTLFAGVIVGCPVLLALAARVIAANGAVSLTINGDDVAGTDVAGMLMRVLFLRLAVPVLGVWYGTSLIADEVEDRTITYLFVRPVRRGAIILGKYLAYLACTSVVLLPAAAVVYLAVVPAVEAGGVQLLKTVGILAIGLAAYGAVFALMGALLNRPLIIGLAFAFGWEQIAMIIPGYLRRFTLVYHLETALRDLPAGAGNLLWLLVVTLVCLMLAAWTVERREYVLDQ